MNRQTALRSDLIMDAVKQLETNGNHQVKAILKVEDRILNYNYPIDTFEQRYDVEFVVVAFINNLWVQVYYRAYSLDEEFKAEHAVNRIIVALMSESIGAYIRNEAQKIMN